MALVARLLIAFLQRGVDQAHDAQRPPIVGLGCGPERLAQLLA
jgi:hypothetical protein